MKLYKGHDAKDSRKKCQQCLRKESFLKKFSVINVLPKKQEAHFLFVYVFIFFIKFMQDFGERTIQVLDLGEGTIQVLFFYKRLVCL